MYLHTVPRSNYLYEASKISVIKHFSLGSDMSGTETYQKIIISDWLVSMANFEQFPLNVFVVVTLVSFHAECFIYYM